MPNPIPMRPMLPLGTATVWGPIIAVGILSGERYYWMKDDEGGIAMMPATVVEPMVEPS